MEEAQKTAGILFYFLGFVVLGAAVLLRNGVYSEITRNLLFAIDLPFVFIALVYGFLSFRLSLGDSAKHAQLADAILIIFGILLFGGALYFNFAFPDLI